MGRLQFIGGILVVIAATTVALWQAGDGAPTAQPVVVPRASALPDDDGLRPSSAQPARLLMVTATESTAAPSIDWLALGLPLTTWAGRVQDHHGNPVQDANVWLVPNGRTRAAAALSTHSYSAFIGLGSEGARNMSDVDLALMPQTTTDASGRFALPAPHSSMHLSPGTHGFGLPDPLLVVAADGLTTLTQRLDAPSGSQADLGVVTLSPASTLTGQIVDAKDLPAQDVHVSVLSQHPWRRDQLDSRPVLHALLPAVHSARTNSTGRFRLEGLWPTQITLGISSPGHISQTVEVEPVLGGELQVRLIRLVRSGAVSGRVSDPDGAAIGGATVFATLREVTTAGRGCVITALNATHDGLPLELLAAAQPGTPHTVTDANGLFVLDGLDSGNYTLYASAPRWESVKLRNVIAGDSDLSVNLEPAARWIVELVDAVSGEAVTDAWVMARRTTGTHDDPALTVMTTAIPHRFEILGAGPQGTTIEIHAPGHVPLIQELDGLATGDTQSTVIGLRPGATLTGVVHNTDGNPREGVPVLLVKPGNQSTQTMPRRTTVYTTNNGAFRFRGLAPGTYSLAPTGNNVRSVQTQRLTVTLAEAEHLDVPLEVVDTCSLSVTVVTPEGRPLPWYTVALFEPGSWAPRLSSQELKSLGVSANATGHDGTVLLTHLTSGSYEVAAATALPQTVEVTPGQPSQLVMVVPYTISGRVTAGGMPEEGVWVYQGRSTGMMTDAHGRYALTVAEFGKQTVKVRASDERVREFTVPVDSLQGATLDVDLGTASLRGVLQSLDGALPAEGLSLTLSKPSGRSWSASTRTDSTGAFVFPYLGAGEYVLQLGYQSRGDWILQAPDVVKLAAGETRELRAQVSRGGIIKGSLITRAGLPVRDGWVVTLHDDQGEEWSSASTHSGAFVINALQPGDYRIIAAPSWYWDDSQCPPAEQWVTVPERGTVTAQLVVDD